MARYPIDRYEHPRLHTTLRELRLRQGMTRAQVIAAATGKGHTLSEPYLAQCETDPAAASSPKASRTPSKDKLMAILDGLDITFEEFESILEEQTPAISDGAAANTILGQYHANNMALTVAEGNEWSDAPPLLWERQKEELDELYRIATPAQRTELLAFARRLTR